MSVLDKFLKYVTFDTQSDADSPTVPSTPGQLVLAGVLAEELQNLGIDNAFVDENGIVYGVLEASASDENRPEIGLIAHMDTAEELSGKDVHPQIVRDYDGQTIVLNEKYSMNPAHFPDLGRVKGHDLVVTDGTTLLGADDKAGIAIIMEVLERVIHENRPHGKIWIAFTPDEEIGRGVLKFNYDFFRPDFAYTVDGGDVRSVDYETFNAAMADVNFTGLAIHPGSAKGRMKNAAAAALYFSSLLPQWQRPEFTEGYEGYFHLLSMEGDVESAHLQYLIRNHDRAAFEHQKNVLEQAAALVNSILPGCCSLSIRDQYYNLKDFMHGNMEPVERARKALRQTGIEPLSLPVRGGTDGAILSAHGLITPNLGAGGGNYHGRFEFASINEMNQMVEAICRILED